MEIQSHSTPCTACLCTDRSLLNITKCQCGEYFKQIISDIPAIMPLVQDLFVCWQCHLWLKKLKTFRRQAEISFQTLYGYLVHENNSSTEYTASLICKTSKLGVSPTHIFSFPEINSHSELDSIKNEVHHITEDMDETESDLKNEDWDNNYDFDVEGTLDEIKIESDIMADVIDVKKPKKSKKLKRLKKKLNRIVAEEVDVKDFLECTDDPDSKGKTKDGKERLRKKKVIDPRKIRMLILSEDEMQLERQKDAQSESYLKLPYKCADCIQGFDYEQTLRDHMDRKHNLKQGKFTCSTCKSTLSTRASFSTHCRRHLLRFECVACGKRTIDKDAIVKHYSAAHEALAATYTCTECGALSDSYRAHRYHKEKHKEKPQCADCGKTFINKNSLRCHVLNMHRGKRTFACNQCDKVYKGKSGLIMHQATHGERGNTAAYCSPCQTHFKTVYNYQHHIKTSLKHVTEDDMRFACDECGAKFLNERRLREHVEWEHRKTQAHSCDTCNKTFKHNVGLERHRKFVHEKKRPPRNQMCHHCGRGFTTRAILRAHIRTHTGERPLACRHCPSTFSHSAALYTHTRLLHRPRQPTVDAC